MKIVLTVNQTEQSAWGSLPDGFQGTQHTRFVAIRQESLKTGFALTAVLAAAMLYLSLRRIEDVRMRIGRAAIDLLSCAILFVLTWF